jgi:transposase-like protein
MPAMDPCVDLEINRVAAGPARINDGSSGNGEEAHTAFRLIRWAATEGAPVCPRCECTAVYAFKTRALWKCKACNHQFSVTSGTIFASRKLPVATYLLAIAIFVNGAKGHSALQLSRDLNCQYKTALRRAARTNRIISPRNAA